MHAALCCCAADSHPCTPSSTLMHASITAALRSTFPSDESYTRVLVLVPSVCLLLLFLFLCLQGSLPAASGSRLSTADLHMDDVAHDMSDEDLRSVPQHPIPHQPQVLRIQPQQPLQQMHSGGAGGEGGGASGGQLKPCFTMTPAQASALLALAAGPAGDFGGATAHEDSTFLSINIITP